MPETTWRGRRAFQVENEAVRVTALVEGGHIAEILHKATGVNPLWTPPWPSIEPSCYSPSTHPEYGADAESKLLAGIMGHNLCMDIFGGPSEEEAAAGLTCHGEASVTRYEMSVEEGELVARAELEQAHLRLERRIAPASGAGVVRFTETVENDSATDRPIGWTQHVTLGPPFLRKGETQFRASATRSKVVDIDFSGGLGYMQIGADFDWPLVPSKTGGAVDLRVFTNAPVSGDFCTHLMDPRREQAFFAAFTPTDRVVFGYVWKRSDFPWLGVWEENYARRLPPWNGCTLTRGMEFGASPFAESRRRMIERNRMFGAPTYRWIPAGTRVRAEYCAFIAQTDAIPEEVTWNGGGQVRFSG